MVTLFLHCRLTNQLWKIFINLRGIQWTMPSKIVDTLSRWEKAGKGARNRSYWRNIPSCIWWTIWKERNARCFKEGVEQYGKSNRLYFSFVFLAYKELPYRCRKYPRCVRLMLWESFDILLYFDLL